MDNSHRRIPYPRRFTADSAPAPTDQPVQDHAGGIQDALTGRLVHRVLREQAHARRKERAKPRAVAGER